MNDSPLNPLSADGVLSAQPAKIPTRATPGDENSPSFEVLLERLQTRAQELDEKSQQVDDPKRLSGAVEAAKASLVDAVSLSDRILEAYLESRHQAEANNGQAKPLEDRS